MCVVSIKSESELVGAAQEIIEFGMQYAWLTLTDLQIFYSQ
jgi:hypothetical protein